jgi:hypothetical protein
LILRKFLSLPGKGPGVSYHHMTLPPDKAVLFIHSCVHLTSNVVLTRFRIFVVSMLTLTVRWAAVLTNIMRQ